jgi:uncharacterized protein YecT (DUF1311 family)
MNHGRIFTAPLAAGFVVGLVAGVLAGMACTAGAAPSFDCAATTTYREEAVCRDKWLASLDQDIAGAYARALARLDSADAARLRQDQRDFITAIDIGFEHTLMLADGGLEHALEEALAHRSEVIGELEEEMGKRLRFLRSLELGRQTLTGKWRNASAELTVTRENAAFAVVFAAGTFGFAHYSCDFEARFVADSGGLKAGAAKHLQTDEEVHNELTLQRRGATLELREIEKETSERRVCPRSPDLRVVLFPVGGGE